MERNEIHKKYAFQYAYDKNGDSKIVNAFTDGFEACERRINFMKPTDILEALIRSLRRKKSEKSVSIGRSTEDPEVLKRKVSEYERIIDHLTECLTNINNECETGWTTSDICKYLPNNVL